ncbi:lysozyme 1-like [Teleopsis dalmanni]|uniref:lysozyme 1-like n=1 Tax=Teleopsis dalmanni TaxID=139649 RepID=UPI0018CEB3C4|nr:lysozyme 1-like [Teleopsis dalmanni]
MKFAVVLIAALALVAPTFATTYNRCSLAKAMYVLGVPKSDLPQWTCIAQHESSFRTDAVGPTNYNGSNDYGIFQINDYYWCQPASGKFSYNECGLSCNALLTNDISNSVRCALKVKSQQGFSAWSTWKYCDGALPSINDCF